MRGSVATTIVLTLSSLLGDGGRTSPASSRLDGAPLEARPPASTRRASIEAAYSDEVPAARAVPLSRRPSVAGLPLVFVENAGQTDPSVLYQANASGYAVYLTRDGMVLVLAGVPEARGADERGSRARPEDRADPDGALVHLRFLDSDPDVRVRGGRRVPGRMSYFLGNDPRRWRTDLPVHSEVGYHGLWPGVDLLIRAEAGRLRYRFVLHPGAQADDIRLSYTGVDGVTVDPGGTAHAATPFGDLLLDISHVTASDMAAAGGAKARLAPIEGDERGVRLEVGQASLPGGAVVVAGGLTFATFLGGSNQSFLSFDEGNAIGLSAGDDVIIAGRTKSADFPTTGGLDESYNGGPFDAFVAVVSSDGSTLRYGTFIGGSRVDEAQGLTVDGAGRIYVVGFTESPDFPTTAGAVDRTYNGRGDAFALKLATQGAVSLFYSTYLGGGSADAARGAALDSSRRLTVVGETSSDDFPTTPAAADPTPNGSDDAFVARLNRDGSALDYATFLGGSAADAALDVALDEAGRAHVGGLTLSDDFPTTPTAFDTEHDGTLSDAFVTKLDGSGTGLLYSTYLGGAGGGDRVFGIEVDEDGNAYLAGDTGSPDFPVTPRAYDVTYNGGDFDAFVTKLDPSGAALGYSTFLGGTASDEALDLALGPEQTAYVTGLTTSADFPTTSDAFDPTFNGGFDATFTRLDRVGERLVSSTFLGGVDTDVANALAVGFGGDVVITGQTNSDDTFPVTPGAFDTSYNGGFSDAFVAKLDVGSAILCDGRVPDVLGTPQNDLLIGTAAGEVIAGLDGNDGIEGRGGNDLVCAGLGDDVVEGGVGRDVLLGERGDDRVDGGDGFDQLVGGSGDDTLLGGTGNDELFGGDGADLMRGGSGEDFCNGGAGADAAASCEVLNGVP